MPIKRKQTVMKKRVVRRHLKNGVVARCGGGVKNPRKKHPRLRIHPRKSPDARSPERTVVPCHLPREERVLENPRVARFRETMVAFRRVLSSPHGARLPETMADPCNLLLEEVMKVPKSLHGARFRETMADPCNLLLEKVTKISRSPCAARLL